MSIDKKRKWIVVAIKDMSVTNPSSSLGLLYLFKVATLPNLTPVIFQYGRCFNLGNTNTGVYDLRLVRVPKYGDSLVLFATVFTYKKGKKQIRVFYIKEQTHRIKEVPGVPEVENSRALLEMEWFGDQFVVGSGDNNLLALVSLE